MELQDNQQDGEEVDWVEGWRIRGGLDLMPNHDDILVEAFLPTNLEEGVERGKLMTRLWDFNTQGRILLLFV